MAEDLSIVERPLPLSQRLSPTSFTPHVSDAGCFASDGEMDVIQQIDVSGTRGSNGRDGQSFVTPSRTPGAHGRRGGDATRANDGQHAGDLQLQLAYAREHRDSNVLSIRGSVGDDVAIGESGYVFIHAAGGKGGDGGRGGDGQPGSTGTRGRDATRYSWGTNGGPGGNGGNAGNPTDGACGGDGGNVTLAVGRSRSGSVDAGQGQPGRR